MTKAKTLEAITKRMSRELASLAFAEPVTHVYDPLDYAWAAHRQYLERFGEKRGRALLLGMNPGPFGMAQTGVPFGEIAAVRDFLGIEVKIGRPQQEHSKRRVDGFACKRSEVSGRRLWGWASARFGTAAAFFDRFFVLNYCPLLFLEESGRNRTPDKLAAEERDAVFTICDEALRAFVRELAPSVVIGVGGFAENRARAALFGADIGENVEVAVGRILHPSPASPIANRGWAEHAERELVALGAL